MYAALIGAFAVMAAALIGYLGTRASFDIPIQMTQAAQATSASKKGTFFTQQLTSHQVMFISSGQLQIGDIYCGGASEQICILVYQTTQPRTVTVESLDPQHALVEVIDNSSPEQVIGTKQASFWEPPNCTSGCQVATVLVFKDGQLARQETINRP